MLAIGLAAGIASGLFGVGGGIVMIPMMLLYAKVDQHTAHATSLAAIVPIALAGAATFALQDAIDYTLAGGLALGSMLGAPIGVRLMNRTSEASLRMAFGILQVGVGLLLLVTA